MSNGKIDGRATDIRKARASDLNDNIAGRYAQMTPRSLKVLMAIVAEAYDIEIEEMFGHTRGPDHISNARMMLLYLLHTEFGLTVAACAILVGRDRTTASHAVHRIEDMRDDPEMEHRIECLAERARSVFNDLEPRALLDNEDARVARMGRHGIAAANGTGSLIFLDGENLGIRAASERLALTAVRINLLNRGEDYSPQDLGRTYSWANGAHHFRRPVKRHAPSAPRRVA